MSTRSAWIASSGARWSAAVAYIRKSGSDFIAWTDIGGQYREETRTLPDGRTLPVFVLVNSTADRRFLLTNPTDYSLTYNGLVMALEKRRSNGWQAFGSYTFSRVYGLQASSGATAARCAGQHRRAGVSDHDVRARSERSHQRARPAAERSPAHVPGDGHASTCRERRRGCGQPAVLQRQAVGGDRAGRRCRRAISASCSSRAARAGCRRRRCWICASRGRSASAAWARIELLFDVLNVLNDTAEESWRRTTCSVRISAAHRLHGSAARDARREVEPRTQISRATGARTPTWTAPPPPSRPNSMWRRSSMPTRAARTTIHLTRSSAPPRYEKPS